MLMKSQINRVKNEPQFRSPNMIFGVATDRVTFNIIPYGENTKNTVLKLLKKTPNNMFLCIWYSW